MPVPEPTAPIVPGTSYSCRDIIKDALRAVQALESGEEPDGDEASDGIRSANRMLDTWNSDGLMLFGQLISDFALVANQATYTLGSLGDFDMARPTSIDYASIMILSNPAQPVEFPIGVFTTQDWREQITVKSIASTLPLGIYEDGGYPLRSLTFWPIPQDNTNLVRLYTPQALTQFPNLSTQMAFPPAYAECIVYNLAIRLAPEYGVSISPEVATMALTSLARVKTSNPDDTTLRSELAGGYGSSNMRSELFGIP